MPLRPRSWLSTVLMLPLVFLLPTWGDVPDPPPLGACYMGFGKTLEAAQSRQLSLNAHVARFLYQPGGLEIAYESLQKDGDEVTQAIRLVGTKRGATTTLTSTTMHLGSDDEQPDMYNLAGWSGDGRYMLINQEHYVKNPETGDGYFDVNFVCVDVGADPIHLSLIALPEIGPASKDVTVGYPHYFWSPDRTRVVFTRQDIVRQGEQHSLNSAFNDVYDPKTGKMQDIAVGDKQVIRGWIDNTHLLLDDSPHVGEPKPSGKVHYASYDIGTGTQVVIPTLKVMPDAADDAGAAGSVLSPKAAYLRLDDEPHRLQDHQKIGTVDTHALWIRRTQGPKLQSVASVGVTPGNDDPQAVWSPNGAQIAFIAHGDLFVTDLTVRDATLTEKYKAGETLTCDEERDLATSNLKQVGLAIIQYCQDYDETYPPADQWQNRVNPYLKDDSLFNVAGHPVVYHVPAKLSLADMDDPANTVLGTIDLPCAMVTLYGDGHVKSLPKFTEQQAP